MVDLEIDNYKIINASSSEYTQAMEISRAIYILYSTKLPVESGIMVCNLCWGKYECYGSD